MDFQKNAPETSNIKTEHYQQPSDAPAVNEVNDNTRSNLSASNPSAPDSLRDIWTQKFEMETHSSPKASALETGSPNDLAITFGLNSFADVDWNKDRNIEKGTGFDGHHALAGAYVMLENFAVIDNSRDGTAVDSDKVAASSERADEPQEKRSVESIDLELHALKSIFPRFGPIPFPHKTEGVVTKDELRESMPTNEPYKQEWQEMMKYFDKVAPGGSLSEDAARKRIETLKSQLPTEEEMIRQHAAERAKEEAKDQKMAEAAREYTLKEGKDPVKTLAAVLKENDIIFVNSPAGAIFQKFIPTQKGSKETICMALPDVPACLAPAFGSGEDLNNPKVPTGEYGEKSVAFLKDYAQTRIGFKEAIQAAKDAGVRIVPVGDNKIILAPADEYSPEAASNSRMAERTIKDNLIALSNEASHPKILVFGGAHGAIHYDGETPIGPVVMTLGDGNNAPQTSAQEPTSKQEQSAKPELPPGMVKPFQTAAYLIAHDPGFQKDHKVASFLTAAPGSEEFASRLDYVRLANGSDTSLCVPSYQNGKETPVGCLYQTGQPYTAGNYDYLIVLSDKTK